MGSVLCLLTNLAVWKLSNTLKKVRGGTLLNCLKCFETYPETFVTQTLSSERGNDRKLASIIEGHSKQLGYIH